MKNVTILFLTLFSFSISFAQSYNIDRNNLIKAKIDIEKQKRNEELIKAKEDSIAAEIQQRHDDSVARASINLGELEGIMTIKDFIDFTYLSVDINNAEYEIIDVEDIETNKMIFLLELNKKAIEFAMLKALLQSDTQEQYDALQESQKQWVKYSQTMIDMNEGKIGNIGGGSTRRQLRMSYKYDITQKRISELIPIILGEDADGNGYTWQSELEKWVDRKANSDDGG